MKGASRDLLEDKDVKEFYLGIRSEESAKGYQRWKRKKSVAVTHLLYGECF